MRSAFFICVLVAGSASASAQEETVVAGPTLCELGELGCAYVDDDTNARTDSDEQALEDLGKPHYIRAAVEEALALGAGTAWYWIDRERQVADWDFPSIKQRLTFEAWRLDSNPFPINFMGHFVNGAGFHYIARSNNINLPLTVVYSFTTSIAWEYLLEFREKVSINDVLLTPTAGATLGEFFHSLGRYLNSAAPGHERPWHAPARWTLGFAHTFHNTIDGRPRSLLTEHADELGLSSAFWHRFRLSAGGGRADISTHRSDDESLELSEVRAFGELISLPGYRKPGKLEQVFTAGNVTSLDVRVYRSESGTNLDLYTETILLGWLRQDRAALHIGGGRASIVGLGVGYRYRKEEIGNWKDRLGILHLPGFAADLDWFGKNWSLRARARIHADFAGVSSMTLPEWKEANDGPDVVLKTILRKHGYYYGWGGSGRVSLELVTPRVELGGSLWMASYASQEGLDRAQEEITDDVPSDDTVRETELWVRGKLGASAYLELRASGNQRDGALGEFEGSQSMRQLTLQLGTAF